MIVVKLWGGLGNQMFQYAFGYNLSKKTGQKMLLDTEFFQNQPGHVGKRSIDIDKLQIPEYECFRRTAILRLLNNKYVGAVTRELPNRYYRVGARMWYTKEPIHKFVAISDVKDSTYFDGYWQSAKYFEEIREELRRIFTPKEPFCEEVLDFYKRIAGEESVAIHMRKGDFGSGKLRKVGHLVEDTYYKRAVEMCRERLVNSKFYVFTDDYEWAKTQLGEEDDIVYVAQILRTGVMDDLFGIANCRNGIMSISTFSWWGNWLRKNDGLVIAPKGEYYNEYFFDDRWVRI